MANTNIQIAISGSTNVDGFTESTNGDFRQAVVIADPSTNAAAMAITSSDAGVGTSEYGAVVRPIMQDAAKLRVSGILDSGSVSSKSSDAGTMLVSAKQGDAGLLRISSIQGDAGLQLISAKQGDAALLRISGILDSGSISAKSGDANQLHVSAVQGDAALLRMSGIGTFTVSAHEVKQSDAASMRVSAIIDSGSISAKQGDAANLMVSAKSNDGALLRTSAIQGDASVQRVSASLFPDTTGGLTAFMSLSVSSAQSVKSSAGSLYGYYAFNKDTKINFLKLYNLSAGLTVGTDTPILTIPLPISGGANAWFGNGIAGFTAGIQMAATSGLPVDNTAAPAASAITVNLFYK